MRSPRRRARTMREGGSTPRRRRWRTARGRRGSTTSSIWRGRWGAGGGLLGLETLEHLARGAGDVAGLPAACPGLIVLAPSRHVLHLAGEHMLPLAPLTLPHAGERDPARALRSAAVALFTAR